MTLTSVAVCPTVGQINTGLEQGAFESDALAVRSVMVNASAHQAIAELEHGISLGASAIQETILVCRPNQSAQQGNLMILISVDAFQIAAPTKFGMPPVCAVYPALSAVGEV